MRLASRLSKCIARGELYCKRVHVGWKIVLQYGGAVGWIVLQYRGVQGKNCIAREGLRG